MTTIPEISKFFLGRYFFGAPCRYPLTDSSLLTVYSLHYGEGAHTAKGTKTRL